MRLFTAVDIPPEIVSKLARLIAGLRPSARISWSAASNLHITTRFIGEWPDERLPELQRALGEVPGGGAIPIEIRGLGFFPNPHSPRVFWAAVHAPAALAELARATDERLGALGLARESRPFSPHLTLARIREPVPLTGLLKSVAALPSLEFGAFTAERFHLYQSRLQSGGSVYTKLSEFPL
jgi:RNA 2',3'-cyclic 3'-phosphodiesterase